MRGGRGWRGGWGGWERGQAGVAGQEHRAQGRALAAHGGASDQAGRTRRAPAVRHGQRVAAGAQHQHVRGALGQRGAVRDGLGQAGVVEAAAVEFHRRARQQRQGGAGPQGQAQFGGGADERAQVGGLAGGRVGGQGMELDGAGQHRGEIHRERGLVQLLDQRPDVGHRAAAQQAGAADEGAGIGGLGPAAQALRPAEQPGAGDGPGRGAVDRVEGGDQAELVQRESHAGRDRAAHAAALDGQRDPEPVMPFPWQAPCPGPLPQHPQHLMHRALRFHDRGQKAVLFAPNWP